MDVTRIQGRVGSWLPLAFIIGLAILIRARINFATSLMPGVNGTYYPVQVRSLLADGKLGYPDFPFIFYLEAVVAKLFFFFKAGSLSDCIMLASKVVDVFFFPLLAIPVFLLARAWVSQEKRRSWVPLLAAAFSVLFFSALVLMADFQKNAAGFVWFFSFVYFFYRALDNGSRKSYIAAGVAFILTGLTHIGCLGLVIVFLFGGLAVTFVFGRLKRQAVFIGGGVLVALLAATIAGLYLFFDPTRVERLFRVFLSPLDVFDSPVIFAFLRGQSGLASRPDWVILNLFATLGAIFLIRRWSVTRTAQKALAAPATLSTFLLASPLLGAEWAERLWFMAYGPAVIIVAFLLAKLSNRFASRAVTILVLVVISLSVVAVPTVARSPSISEAAYAELQEIRAVISDPKHAFVMARHGLEWWAAWVLETDAGQWHGLDKESWEKYDQVFYLRQLAGAANYGPSGPTGPGGATFPEVEIPDDAEILFKGDYFTLARATSMPRWGPPDEGKEGSVIYRIEHLLRDGEEIVETSDPGFELPPDVYKAQVNKYFRIGNVYFATVLQSSMNITLDLADGQMVSFVGVLVGLEGQGSWEKFLRIEDKGGNYKNNPYYMWNKGEKIFLTVVDHNGAGSGEGNMKLVRSDLGWGWGIDRCYYFVPPAGGEKEGCESVFCGQASYFEFSKKLYQHQEQSMKRCENLTVTLELLSESF